MSEINQRVNDSAYWLLCLGFGRFCCDISGVCVVGMALGSRLAIGVICKCILVFSDLG